MIQRTLRAVCVGLLTLAPASPLVAQDRAAKVRQDKQQLADNQTWIYNDLARATDEARRTNKPLFVVLRTGCSLDAALIERIKARAVGQDVLKSLTPGQTLVKVVREELTAVMGAATSTSTSRSRARFSR